LAFVFYIWAVKKRIAIFPLGFAIAILFSILLQSVDSLGHLARQFSEKQCHHKFNSAVEITHQHHNFDHCMVCDFTLGNLLSAQTFSYQLHIALRTIPYFNNISATAETFSGSVCSLRGPPTFIV